MSEEESGAAWEVVFTSSARKQKKKLPQPVSEQLAVLLWDLEHTGPVQPEWKNYGALKKASRIPLDAYHCHIKSGRPTYVVCWRVENKKIQIIEIFYVGTHENAPY
jgi:mRNA-degrading endonuclease RelE of RelBE toxin-antitoxin system